ncbi:G-protein coupled receptor 157-like [Mya arenaria]|uniref:G-protein coupled receptor 157-like n=1 Tax=Mya arenaria TaxID=6604 RepID=UPI0022E29B80|nr:G-protein coupled receptor 157-like [Mya arenaria]
MLVDYIRVSRNHSNSTSPDEVVPKYIIFLDTSSCGLSLISSAIIIMMFWPKSPCRIPADGITKHMRCLLVWLSIANSIHCTADFVGALWYYRVVQEKANPQHHLHGLCLAQGVLSSFAPFAEFLWTTVISLQITFLILGCGQSDTENERSNRRRWVNFCCDNKFPLVCWGLPALVCVFGLGFRVFGETGHLYSGPWCWIKKGLPQGWKIFWMFMTMKAWELLAYFSSAMCLTLKLAQVLDRWLRRVRGLTLSGHSGSSVAGVAPEAPQEADTLQDADRTFFCVVWIIFYVFRVPGTINFILEIAYPGSHKEQLNYIKNVLMGMEAFGDDAQAFGNLVFLVIFNKEVRAWLSCKRNCVRPRNARDERSSLIQSTDNHAEPV